MYIIRLDDASEYMDIEKWNRMERLLNKYDIKPIFGIIPVNGDPDLLIYNKVENFWNLMKSWINHGWIVGLHGYSHVFETEEGGINPVNNRSEFAGVSFERQAEKIRNGVKILLDNGIEPKVFFAPAHTFDRNTIAALKQESNIRIISDTIANNIYYDDDMYFIPQQLGKCRELPFKITTFCYHPNCMNDEAFENLEKFIIRNKRKFGIINNKLLLKRKRSLFDILLHKIYFIIKRL